MNSDDAVTKQDLRDFFDDMKQYIGVELENTSKSLKTELKKELKTELLTEIDKRFTDQDAKLDEIMNAVGDDLAKHSATLDDHSTRLVSLEQKAA